MHFIVLLLINLSFICSEWTADNFIYDGHNFFQEFNNYNAIKLYLYKLKSNYPSKINLFDIGKTREGRKIMVVKVSTNKLAAQRPAILIDAGIHGREWASSAAALYLLSQLVTVEKNKNMIKNLDWYIIPILNPDGYIYSQSVNKLWRKNRASGQQCDGVDLNRNFNYFWRNHGSSKNECSPIYSGPYPFSEPESRAFKDFVLSIKKNIKGYISLHTFGNQIFFPWGYSKKRPSNVLEYNYLSQKIVDEMKKVRGTKYKAGQLSRMLYYASGITLDWMAGYAKIPLCFVIELGDPVWQFDIAPSEILPISKETFEAMKMFQQHIEIKWLLSKS